MQTWLTTVRDYLSEVLTSLFSLHTNYVTEYKEITAMFIDMVGFSVGLNDDVSPPILIKRLSSNIGYLERAVQAHHGKINRTTGDGLLAYFEREGRHADDALQCAISIQRECLRRSTFNESNINYPLRIGIDTNKTLIGKIGNSKETILVGNSLIVASRLEASCEPFRIMLGCNSKEALSADSLTHENHIVQRWVLYKHQKTLTKAYELNPFYGERRLDTLCRSIYRKFLCNESGRNTPRWQLPEHSRLHMQIDDNEAIVFNISNCGFGVYSPKYLAKGVVMEVTLRSPLQHVNEQLLSSGLMPLTVEVRWGLSEGNAGHTLGLRVVSLNSEQGNILLHICLGVLRSEESA